MPHEVYAAYKNIVKQRIPSAPNHWFTVALTLAIGGNIWTTDNNFLRY
ncbi:PIN domain-containing protein [Myxosarcina sp. GI1]